MAFLSVLPDMSSFGKGIVAGAGKEVDKSGKAVGGKFGKAMLAGVAVVATGAVLATKALYGIGETFAEVENTIRVGTGATGDALTELVDSAKNIGRNVPAEFEAIGVAVADLNTRLGLSGPVLETVASQVLELGRITGEEVDINGLSGAFKQFKIEGEDTTTALDHLYRVSQATGIGVNDLAAQAAAAAPTMNTLGFSFEETTALIGNLDKAGLNSTQVMKGMQTGMVNLAKDGEAPADAFNRVVGEIGGFIEAGDEAAAIDLAGQAFGTRGAPAMVAALRDGTLSLEDMNAVAGMTEDTILGAGEETMEFGEKWLLFKNRIIDQVEPAATALFDAIGDGMEWVTNTLLPQFLAGWSGSDGPGGIFQDLGERARGAFEWIKENKDILLGLVGVLVAAKVAVMAYNTAMAVWRGITTTITALTKAKTVAMRVLNTVMRMNPIGLVVTALMLLVGAFKLAWDNSETFRNVVTGAWEGIKAAAMAVWEWLKNAFQWIKDGLSSVGQWFIARGKQIGDAWQAMRDAISAGWNWIKTRVFDAFTAGISAVSTWFTDKVNTIKAVWGGLKSAFRAVWDWIDRNVFQNFMRGIDTVVGWVRDGIGLIGDLWDGLKNLFMAPINWVIREVWNGGIVRVFNAVANVIPGVSPMSTQPEIRARAKGGYTPPGWTLVGEEGPELVNFTRPNRVYTAAETQAMLAGQTPNPLARQVSPSNPPHGGVGGWFSDRWDDVKSGARWVADGVRDAAGNVAKWARGGLAKAAGIVLDPIKSLIGSTLGTTGRFGEMAGGMATSAIDRVLDWVGGHDEGAAPDAGGRSLRGAQPHVNNAAHALADAVGGIRTMQAFNQSMAGGHPAGKAVDFIDSISKLDRLADVIAGGGHFDDFNYMAWQGRLWSPGRGWRAQGRGFGNDPMHRWHLHAEWHDQGGMLQPGLSMLANGTRKPEPVLTAGQWDDISTLAARGAHTPKRVLLQVGAREFEAYMSEVADGQIASAQATSRRTARQTSGRG